MAAFGQLWQYLKALANELSDQTAYRRHLEHTGRSHSACEWRRFSDGRHQRKYRNAKCC
jgi:hypothetical protein